MTNAAFSRYITASVTSCISPIRPIGCNPLRKLCVSGECIGVLIAPGETAFTRTWRLAYSIASERVIALSPPWIVALAH